MKFKHAVMLGALYAASMAVSAQWLWIDKDGHKVFSDRSPPADTPEKNILRQPGNRAAAALTATAPASAASEAATPARPSGKNKELEDKRKQAAQAEENKHKAEEEKDQKTKADNCRMARQAKASLDSGVRIARPNEKGEREFLDDAGRAAEANRLQSIIQTQCQ